MKAIAGSEYKRKDNGTIWILVRVRGEDYILCTISRNVFMCYSEKEFRKSFEPYSKTEGIRTGALKV